jgi:outer membrane protein assembly factor BamD
LWRKPTLDPQYGQTALATYRQLLTLYPDSKLVPEAARQIADLNAMFAQKDYNSGDYYLRRKAWDSAIIYFKDVVKTYGNTPRARDAYLRLAEAYRAIHYREDVNETCTVLRQRYPSDREVREVCGAAPATVARDTVARDSTKRPIP